MVLVATSGFPVRRPSPAAVSGPHLSERSPQWHPQGAALHGPQQAPVTCSRQVCVPLEKCSKPAPFLCSSSWPVARAFWCTKNWRWCRCAFPVVAPSHFGKVAMDFTQTPTANFNLQTKQRQRRHSHLPCIMFSWHHAGISYVQTGGNSSLRDSFGFKQNHYLPFNIGRQCINATCAHAKCMFMSLCEQQQAFVLICLHLSGVHCCLSRPLPFFYSCSSWHTEKNPNTWYVWLNWAACLNIAFKSKDKANCPIHNQTVAATAINSTNQRPPNRLSLNVLINSARDQIMNLPFVLMHSPQLSI